MKTKQLILNLLLILFTTSCCIFEPSKEVYYLDDERFKYDGKYTGIDTLIRIDGYYNYFSGSNSEPLMFFVNGEFAKGVVDEQGINDEINTWGGYVVDSNIISLQFVWDPGFKCFDAVIKLIEYYEIIDNVTLVRQKEAISTSSNTKIYYDTFDTLKFVKSDYLMKSENQKIILEENWLRKHRYNWKEGYYPGDK